MEQKKPSLFKRFRKWLKKYIHFSKNFIHPEIDNKLNTVVEDKIKSWRSEYEKKKEEHDQKLKSFLRTYFDREYASELDMQVAFDTINNQWKDYVREVNSTSKVITLSRTAFTDEVKAFIKRVKANEEKRKAANV